MKIYKYIKKEHLEEFKNKGAVFLNTLFNLRFEPHEPIRDMLEGHRKVLVKPKSKPIVLSSDEAEKLFPNLHFTKRMEKAITVSVTSEVIGDMEVPDAFVFSASKRCSKDLCKKFGYDAYYQINKPLDFAQVVFEELNKQVTLKGFIYQQIRYTDKLTVIRENKEKALRHKVVNSFEEICFSKPKDYGDEKEVRIVFIPQFDRGIKPLKIYSLALLDYCSFPKPFDF